MHQSCPSAQLSVRLRRCLPRVRTSFGRHRTAGRLPGLALPVRSVQCPLAAGVDRPTRSFTTLSEASTAPGRQSAILCSAPPHIWSLLGFATTSDSAVEAAVPAASAGASGAASPGTVCKAGGARPALRDRVRRFSSRPPRTRGAARPGRHLARPAVSVSVRQESPMSPRPAPCRGRCSPVMVIAGLKLSVKCFFTLSDFWGVVFCLLI